jgi:hypothetical protein
MAKYTEMHTEKMDSVKEHRTKVMTAASDAHSGTKTKGRKLLGMMGGAVRVVKSSCSVAVDSP